MNPFKVTIEKLHDTKTVIVESFIFESKLDAKKCIQSMIKKYSLIRHAGHIVNYSNYLELYTNF